MDTHTVAIELSDTLQVLHSKIDLHTGGALRLHPPLLG
jgi:hypothetical protein